jgi:hypothetical protein
MMLAKVAAARGLPVRNAVASKVLDRDEILQRIKRHVEADVPLETVAKEGEVLAALELIPEDYDLVAGMFRLVGAEIAGFYEPSDQTMYLTDDQSDAELEQTLAHELDHALQDQSFSLEALLKYTKGASDKTAAIHALVEGDAVSAMLDVEVGSALRVSETAIRRAFKLGSALNETGATTPHVLTAELVSPYVDGFAFVQALRKRGGWAAVDRAWRELPQTTEQVLHIAKYDAREAAIEIAVPPIDALGAGWSAVLDDVMGEAGLVLTFGEWAPGASATEAAAGWGGDRYVVAEHDLSGRRREVAVGWHLRMDTDRDAGEVEALLSSRFGSTCRSRKTLGPIAWKRKARDLAVVAGPYVREGSPARITGPSASPSSSSAGDCTRAKAWAKAILAK